MELLQSNAIATAWNDDGSTARVVVGDCVVSWKFRNSLLIPMVRKKSLSFRAKFLHISPSNLPPPTPQAGIIPVWLSAGSCMCFV